MELRKLSKGVDDIIGSYHLATVDRVASDNKQANELSRPSILVLHLSLMHSILEACLIVFC